VGRRNDEVGLRVRRTGIDLSPTRCIVVDAEMTRGFRTRRDRASLRVHHFASLHVGSNQDLAIELKGLIARKALPKHAWVNLWGMTSTHQYLLLPTRPRAELDETARFRAATTLAMDPHDVAIGTILGRSTHRSPGKLRRSGDPRSKKTEVVFFAAALEDIRARLRPIVEAGFVVDGVTTPCGALWSQARLRRPGSGGDVHAFVALGAQMSALAIFANGFFLYGRDLSWGYAGRPDGLGPPMDREELADRVAVELRRSFLYVKQYWEPDVTQLQLCGDMSEIRSLTAPLIDRLNIEVETLDTLDGIDPTKLPEPADRFSEHVAAFRLASAIAVESLPVNLLASNEPTGYLNRTNRRLVAVGSAAAVAFAAFAYTRSGGVDGNHGRGEGQIAAVQREQARPQPQPVAPAVPKPASVPAARQVPKAGATSAATTPPDARALPPGARAVPADARALPADARALPPDTRVPPAQARVVPSEARELRGEAPARRRTNAGAVVTGRRQETTGLSKSAQPDPVVRSILYSASRQVALIDGRIVKPGDRVGVMLVSAIERDGVILTTPSGLRKRVGLDRPAVKFGHQ
jgi:hypothetical protein